MPAQKPEYHDEVEATFLSMMDEIASRVRVLGRFLSPTDKEELTAEAWAWSWSLCLSAARRGKLDQLTARSLARYSYLLFVSGRRFGGTTVVNDVLSEQARAQGRVGVLPLDLLGTWKADGTAKGRAVSRALTDSRRPRPDEECRVDMDIAQRFVIPGCRPGPRISSSFS